MTHSFIVASIAALALAGVASTAQARCAAGVNHAACAGPNGAVVAGPNGVHTATRTNNTARPYAGASATGPRGNTATKGVQQGCGWVNGQRVCR